MDRLGKSHAEIKLTDTNIAAGLQRNSEMSKNVTNIVLQVSQLYEKISFNQLTGYFAKNQGY